MSKANPEAMVVPKTIVSRKFSIFNLVILMKKVPGIIRERVTSRQDRTKYLSPMFATRKTLKIGIEQTNVIKPRLTSLLSKITSVALRLDRIVL
jgi:hypothetical protein